MESFQNPNREQPGCDLIKKGEPIPTTPPSNFKGQGKGNYIDLIKRIVPYLFNTVATPGMASKDLDIPIESVKTCLGNLLRGSKIYMVYKDKCPVTGKQEYFLTTNIQKSKEKPGQGLKNE